MDAFETSGNSPTDFDVVGEGSIYVLRPLTPAAHEWIDAHLPDDALRFAGAVVVEHRFIGAIVEGARADGLEVR